MKKQQTTEKPKQQVQSQGGKAPLKQALQPPKQITTNSKLQASKQTTSLSKVAQSSTSQQKQSSTNQKPLNQPVKSDQQISKQQISIPNTETVNINDTKREETIDEQNKPIKISLEKQYELRNCIKDIQAIELTNSNRIYLILKTKFETDADLQQFSAALQKIAKQVHKLKWTISGKFTDAGSAKSIGETFGMFKNAFTIDMKASRTQFADKCAQFFARGLSSLNNLQFLKVDIETSDRTDFKEITQIGKLKIQETLSELQQLQTVNFNYLNWNSFKTPPQLSNYVYFISNNPEENEQIIQVNSEKEFLQFKDRIDQLKSHLTFLELQNYDNEKGEQFRGSCLCCSNIKFNFKYQSSIYSKIIKYCIEIPYLTRLSSRVLFHNEPDSQKKYLIYENVAMNYSQSQLSQIIQISAFNNSVRNLFLINPIMIITDLFIP